MFVVVFGIKEDPVKRMKTVLFESIEAFGEIAERFNISKPSISHHLDILKQADLVTSEKKGQFVEYSLNTTILEDLLNWILTLKK